MNDELKAVRNLGTELGAAKAEIEALREQVRVLQSDANSWQSGYDRGRHDGAKHRKSEVEQLRQHKNEYMDAAEVTRKALLAEIESLRNGLKNARYRIEQGRVWNGMGWTLTGLHAHQQQKALDEIDAALSQQSEPTDTYTYTATDMINQSAQGFRDGQAAVEPAPAQDERDFNPDHTLFSEIRCSMPVNDDGEETRYIINEQQLQRIRALEFNRPAQTEQQPAVPAGFVLLPLEPTEAILDALHSGGYVGDDKELRELYQSLLDAAPIAQTAPQGKFRMGDLVKKSTGSEWEGRVVGWYSTTMTPEGYAVESEAHAGSVQIYPAKALEAVE